MYKTIAFLSIVILTGVAFAPPSFAGKKPPKTAKVKKIDLQKAPGYKEAMADFKAGHFGPAATQLEKLDRTGFCCDNLHYLLAQCYQQTNQLKQAQTHYAWILTYSHNPSLRTYSETACQQLQYYGDHRGYSGQGANFDQGMKAQSRDYSSSGSAGASSGGGSSAGDSHYSAPLPGATMKRDSYGNLHL